VAEEIEGTFHYTPLYPASIGAVSKQEEPQTNIGTILSGEAIIPPAFVADKSDGKANLEIILEPKMAWRSNASRSPLRKGKEKIAQ
jgi:hypothetical protein